MLRITVDGWDFSPDQTMTPGEVARAFGANPKTVARWGKDGKLASICTPGGHRRYSRQQVEHIMHGGES
jgi:excisionase family DNA binding protein